MRRFVGSGMPGAALREIRKRLRMTQKQFAAALGIHHITVSDYERGKEVIPKLVAVAAKGLK
jgi:transcriptional regulator with XRE-family HTH domain